MKVFISWSGERSRAVALALREWLPDVLQAVQPFMSEQDVDAGERGLETIAEKLKDTQVGIVCLTPENQHKPWLNFESGALSKLLDDARVCPFLLDLTITELTGPLTQFQGNAVGKEGTRKVVASVNRALGEAKLPEAQLDRTFETWWPKLRERLDAIPEASHPKPARPIPDVLEELVGLVRGLTRASHSTDRAGRYHAVLIGRNGTSVLPGSSDGPFDPEPGVACTATGIYMLTEGARLARFRYVSVLRQPLPRVHPERLFLGMTEAQLREKSELYEVLHVARFADGACVVAQQVTPEEEAADANASA